MRPAVVSEMRLPKRSNSSAVQLLLELAHLGADRRLRAVARLRGFRKTLQPNDLQERVELIEVHNAAGMPGSQLNYESAG